MRKERDMYEPGVRRTRTVQALFWCALILIQLFVISKLEVRAEESAGSAAARIGEVQIEEIPIKEIPIEEAEWRETLQAGEVYLPPRRRRVEKEVIYRQVEELAQIPETMYIGIREPEDGRKGGGVCSRASTDTLREIWSDSFSFPVTFHGCDADYFQLGDRQIPYDENRPRLEGCEDLLLELIGAPEEAYRITDVRWDGEAYLDSAGVLCRNALASGEKLVRDYQVSYRGTVVFPARTAVGSGIVLEEPQDRDLADGSGTEIRLESGEDRLPEHPEDRETFWKRLIRTVTLAVSLLLLVALILFLLAAWRKRRGDKQA